MNICVITDNEYIYNEFQNLIKDSLHRFTFFYSYKNAAFLKKYSESNSFRPINLKEEDDTFFSKYGLFFSLHCKQLFPSKLVDKYRCINIHPGLNPFNRGWFPQVFSIINKKPIGVTIHEMDNQLDHGPIIYQKEINIKQEETSYDIYCRIQRLEIEMLKLHLDDLILGKYKSYPMKDEGNINYMHDFKSLCKIELNQIGTFGEFIDILRATTFNKYDNSYFMDNDGNKIYVSINLKKEI